MDDRMVRVNDACAPPRPVHGLLCRTVSLILPLLVAANSDAQNYSDPALFCVGCSMPRFADMDDDGLKDALIMRNDSLLVRHGAGAGFSAPSLLFVQGSNTEVIQVAHLDEDAIPDIILTRAYIDPIGEQRDSLGILWSGSVHTWIESDSAMTAREVYAVDMDSDGDRDLVHRSASGMNRYDVVHRNLGQRLFGTEFYPAIGLGGGIILASFVPFDWDGDGDNDLMGGTGLNGNISVSYNIGGQLGYPYVEVHGGFNVPPSSDVLDLNADGALDFIAASHAYLRSPAGGIDIRCCFAQTGPGRSFGNVDCDAAIEVLAPAYAEDGVRLNIWDLSISGFIQRSTLFDVHFPFMDIIVVDMNADGLDDILYKPQSATDSLFFRVNITTEPDVNLDPPTTTLPGDTVIALDWGWPAGGLYGGPGVFDNVLYTALTNDNLVELTYTYRDPLTTCLGEASAFVQSAVGIHGIPASSSGQVYPNPTVGPINFTAPSEGDVQLDVLDAFGRIALDLGPIKASAGEIIARSIQELQPGCYILRVRNAKGIIMFKPVIRSAEAH